MAKARTPAGRRGGQTGRGAQAATVTASAAEPAAPRKRTSPMQFVSQVRAEGRKITWPSRKETWITSVMVFIMVALAALFFWVVDVILAFGANLVLQIGR